MSCAATDSSVPRSLGRVPGSQLVAAEGGLSASSSGPTETAVGVTLNIHQDVLSIIRANAGEASRRTSRETDEMRTLRLIRQVTELRHVHSVNYAYANYAWRCDEHDEPLLLPDTGAVDGLCGDRWAIHAGRWAKTHGHEAVFDKLEQTKTVSGVGKGSQTAIDRLNLPIAMEDVKGEHHFNQFRAAVVRESFIPGLMGIQSLARLNVVMRCCAGEIYFLGKEGCEIKPCENHVHIQMKKNRTGHWCIPIGRFAEAMKVMGKGRVLSSDPGKPVPIPAALSARTTTQDRE